MLILPMIVVVVIVIVVIVVVMIAVIVTLQARVAPSQVAWQVAATLQVSK